MTTKKIALCKKKLRSLDADLTSSQMQYYKQAVDLIHALNEQLQCKQELYRQQLVDVEKKRVGDIRSTDKESSGGRQTK